ncbi:histidine phosphatase family protein [Pelagibius litoralis]|uniref:Histidine phosphatase family protein n=1 Tax=Pelagibius litoralis TaxID=374515 RepID=A0A967EYC5_9PROT|nr:histidine phosphatase family protein [Pelagibius litoralis]NIA69624.1 histidine phosphatase family protein [Pelagibius litoralis]
MRAALLAIVISVLVPLGWISVAAAAEDPTVLQRLDEPRTHAIMRHALAPGTGDPADFALGDCTTQRNLNDRGRDQARAIGAAFQTADIAVDQVLTSQWCRCAETARLLGLGTVTEEPALSSFFADRSTAAAQTAVTRDLLAAMPEDQTAILVTHQVNITALIGVFPRSGEVFVLKVGDGGEIEVLGSFLAAE